MENKLSGRKKHARALLLERVQLQHEMRILDRTASQMTSRHKMLLDDLFRLSTAVYTEIRIKAQRVITGCINVFDYLARMLVPSVMAKLQPDPEVSHEELKGALYIVQRTHFLYVSVHYWEIMVDVWPAIVKVDHSEKPSIVGLISIIASKMFKKYITVAISREVTDSLVRHGEQLLKSSNPAPRSSLNPPANPDASPLPGEAELKLAAEAVEERREANLRNYHSLVDTLVSLLEGNTRWRYLQICFNFFFLLIRDDVPLPPKAVALCVRFLTHDSLGIRKTAICAVGAILKQQKRPHLKIAVDPYTSAGVAEPTSKSIQPGDRPDNHWLQFVGDELPRSQEEWNAVTFIDKTHWGYYTWPKTLLTYAPVAQQPPLGRQRDELTKAEQPIYDSFIQEDFLSKFLAFLSLEDRKGHDKFDFHRFLLFKGLFRNFDDAFLELLMPHLERLCADSQESSQRCAAEIIAALVRGCKHWPYEKSERLWDLLVPLIRKAIACISVETLHDWGTCTATAVESRDPRRIHRFLMVLLEDPLLEDGGSFTVSSRLYLAQGALSQQEWRVSELLHKFVHRIEQHLNHSYKNVRDRIGSVLCSSLMFDLQLPNSPPSRCPRLREFVDRILPQLSGLQELVREREVAASAESSDDSEESEARKDSIKRLKTINVWLYSHIVRTLHSCPKEFIDLLQLIILFDSQEDDPELQQYCSRTIDYMAQRELAASSVPLALDAVKKLGGNTSWHARRSLLGYLQVMVIHNIFRIRQNPQHVQDIKDLVLKLLGDEQLEVREVAATTLSGLVHYRLFDIDKEMQTKFRKMANTKLPKKKKAGVPSSSLPDDDPLIRRHTGVLGLASCVQAFPYDVPDWMPQMLVDLGAHLHDPNPIQATVKKVMTDFRRTHHDNWLEHKQKFAEDQLVVLTDLLVSPCYYA